MLGRISEFDTEIETFTALAEKLNQPQCLWYTRLLRALRCYMEGRYEEGKSWAQRMLRSGQRVKDQNAIHSFMVHAVISSIDLGGLEYVEDNTRKMVDEFPRVIAWRAGLALVCAEQSKFREAEEHTEWLLRAGALDRPKRSEWFGTMGSLVFATGLLQNIDLADRLYPLLVPHADHLAVIGYCSFCWGSVRHWLGILSTVLERWDEAECHFEAAITTNMRVGARPWLARAEYDFARMISFQGKDPTRAEECLRSCAVLAEELGMSRLLEKIHGKRGVSTSSNPK
jgi:tetratricopeptide (TPR) repeat protein